MPRHWRRSRRTGCWRCSVRGARKSCSWSWTRATMPRSATTAHPPVAGPVQPGPREGRSRGHRSLRRQPQGSAAGRAGRPEDRAGPGPGHPHRLQDRRGRRHRQAGRARPHLPARAAPAASRKRASATSAS
ncbi:hypothetical protein G6F46_013893 [Rhizopus delemar]|nr:hypothetical protein G6F46_013893 [Rhizopus delemar]